MPLLWRYEIMTADVEEALLDMLYEARESEDIGQAVLNKYEAALHTLGVEYDEED